MLIFCVKVSVDDVVAFVHIDNDYSIVNVDETTLTCYSIKNLSTM